MKKGLLSILAGALVLVGCQNYDDQFDALESQINALSSTVAGLSQVQSDLASLAGTVSSLASTVNSLGSTIDASVASGISGLATAAEVAALQTKVEELSSLATGLATLQTTVDALTASLADVASSAEVDAIKTALASAQADLDELLANSTVYSDNITINSEATLNAFHAMGDGLAIVNGNVTFTVSEDMDLTKVQAVADQLLTITKDLTYTSASKDIAEVKFNNLSGVQSMTITQTGGFTFPKLVSATVIALDVPTNGKIEMVDFRKLGSVTSIKSGTNDHSIVYDDAKEIHLTSLKRYPTSSLSNPFTIEGLKGGVIDITALDDIGTDGTQADLHLKITGPKTMDITKITDGSIELKDVATASVTAHAGTLKVLTGVETLTVVDGVKVSLLGATDLVTASIDLKLDDDEDISTATTIYEAEDVDVTGLDNLKTLTVTGNVDVVDVDDVDNLDTLVINAVMDDLTINDALDLTSVTVTGSKIHDITVTNNPSLTILDLDHTTALDTSAKTAEKAASLNVSTNIKLEELHYDGNPVDALTITGNDALAKVAFANLKAIGSTTANVNISDNNFTASMAQDDYQATGKADAGKFTSTSGLSDLKTYLAAAAKAPGANGVKAFFDKVTESKTQGNSPTADYTLNTSPSVDQTDADNIATIVFVTADDTSAVAGAKLQTQSWWIPINASAANGSIQLITNANFVAGGTDEGFLIDYPVTADTAFEYSSTDTDLDTLDEFITYFNTNADLDSFDLTLSATGGYAHTYLVSFVDADGSTGSVETAGNVMFDYGTTVTGITRALVAGDDDLDLASDIAGALDANATFAASFTASHGGTSGYAYIIVNPNMNATEEDKTPVRKWTPSNITISRTGGSVSWSGLATNGETSFTLSIGSGVARYEGFILTAKNTNRSTNRSITVYSGTDSVVTGGKSTNNGTGGGFWGVASELTAASFYNDGDIDGDSDTTVVSQIGDYVRAYSETAAAVDATPGEDTDKTGWL